MSLAFLPSPLGDAAAPTLVIAAGFPGGQTASAPSPPPPPPALPPQPSTEDCVAEWLECAYPAEACCAPLACYAQNPHYAQCRSGGCPPGWLCSQPALPSPPPSPATASTPATLSTTATATASAVNATNTTATAAVDHALTALYSAAATRAVGAVGRFELSWRRDPGAATSHLALRRAQLTAWGDNQRTTAGGGDNQRACSGFGAALAAARFEAGEFLAVGLRSHPGAVQIYGPPPPQARVGGSVRGWGRGSGRGRGRSRVRGAS